MASERRCGFCRFTLDPFSHHVSLCPIPTFHLPHGSVIAGFWIVSKYLWECCPRGLHSVISRLLAGGSLGFRIVPLLLPGSQITVWHFVVLFSLLFSFAIPIPEVIQCYHLFWYVSDACELTDQLITGRAGFWCVFVCFVWFWVFVVCFFVLHGDSSMDYVSIQFSSLLYAHCRYDWCCHCINSVNLHNAIVFPAW